jgi:hypothetical protein
MMAPRMGDGLAVQAVLAIYNRDADSRFACGD